MAAVFPLGVVIRPGSRDTVDDLVRVADVVIRGNERVEYGSHRKGLELRCVWIDDADEVVGRLNDALKSEVRVVDKTPRLLTEPDLMEPVMRVEILVSAMLTPVTMALFNELRGEVLTQAERDTSVALIAQAPLQELLDLPSRLRALSDGEAHISSVTFSHYARILITGAFTSSSWGEILFSSLSHTDRLVLND